MAGRGLKETLMRILLVNHFFFGRGDAERYLFALRDLLPKTGHQVAEFAFTHPRNRPSAFSNYFAPAWDQEGDDSSGRGPLRLNGKISFLRETIRRLTCLVREFQPEVAHLHHLAPELAPALLLALRRAQVPVVWTLHDFMLACPNHQLFHPEEEAVCEACRGRKYYRALARECLAGSPLAGALAVLKSYGVAYLGIYRRGVNRFLVPSRFLAERLIPEGIPAERLLHLPYFAPLERLGPHFSGDGFGLYTGRLSPGKGLHTLLNALVRVPQVRFYLAGSGPLGFELRRRADHLGLKQVRFVGHASGTNLETLRRRASFIVVPSESYENCPLAVLEAFAAGKPVLASRLGGLTELVREGETGRLFSPGDVSALAAAIVWFAENPAAAETLGRGARRLVETEYNPAGHLERLLGGYQLACGKGARVGGTAGTGSLPSSLSSGAQATHAA